MPKKAASKRVAPRTGRRVPASKPRHSRDGDQPSDPFLGDTPYSLTFLGGYDAKLMGVEAVVTSPLIDRVMHGEKPLRVLIAIYEPPKRGPIVLDSFRINSLRDYLQRQQAVRKLLESELLKDQAEWAGTKQLAKKPIWSHAQVDSVLLDQRMIQKPKAAAKMKREFPNLPAAFSAAASAQPDERRTKAAFTAVISVDWDDEHRMRLVKFRDGKLVDFSLG